MAWLLVGWARTPDRTCKYEAEASTPFPGTEDTKPNGMLVARKSVAALIQQFFVRLHRLRVPRHKSTRGRSMNAISVLHGTMVSESRIHYSQTATAIYYEIVNDAQEPYQAVSPLDARI